MSLDETNRHVGRASQQDYVLKAALGSIGDAVIVTNEQGQIRFPTPPPKR